MKKIVLIFLFLLPIAFGILGKESFTIIINPDIVGIKAKIIPNPANWYDKIKIEGYAIPASGEIYTQKIEVWYENSTLCENYTDVLGYFECYFICEFGVGDYNLTLRVIRNDTGGITGEKNLHFKVYPHFGKMPKGNVISIEIPNVIYDIDGKIKRVIAVIYFGY